MDDKYEKLLENLLNDEEETTDIVETSSMPTDITFSGKLVDATNDDELTAMVLISALEDKDRADDLYDVFKTSVELSKDRSDSSKEALTAMVQARINATANLVKILDIRSKRKQTSGNNFLNLNISPRKADIDLKNITDNLKDYE